MKRAFFNVFSIMTLAVGIFAGTAVAEETGLRVPDTELKNVLGAKAEAAVYIIRMADDPVVAYEGGIAGLPATKPGKAQKINPNSASVRGYVAHLASRHDAALRAVGASDKKVYSYSYTFNGFAAVLTSEQAASMAAQPGVVSVQPDVLRQLETDNTPDFLGLTAEGGLWDMGYEGEDVIIGVIDTGIWPEHPSFSDQEDLTDRPGNSGKRTRAYGSPPADWYGDCQSGERWSQDDCNNKLIGARYFKDGFSHRDINLSGDYLSPRDADGHGSSTASAAGGNAGVPASTFGVDRETVSGIAPRARIAAYKACWADAGCAVSDLTRAIDQAVADGVDVINYSIGSSATALNADDIAFLFAADAGVFIATSNGNSGPGAQTSAAYPWLTSVGASTQNRTFRGSAFSSDGWEYFGASVTGDTDELPLVDAEDAGSELCEPGELDPSVVSGKIVLCLRGVIARVDKSRAVYMAGGAGTILYNASAIETLNTDNHWTPAVHITNTDGVAIKAYIDTASEARAKINGGVFTTIPAPDMATFSSRGPNGSALDIIKPDITAPGVNILAANSPTPFLGSPGQLFQAISGTSMSSPHVAGVFALLKEAHPEWSPAEAKSALMTTASQDVKKEDGITLADPFDMGSGHLNPNPSVDPGLVYDAGFLDYLAFLCGNNPANISQSTCDFLESQGYSTDPSDLNHPSIGVADLVGFQTVTRTVTNVTPGTATYNVSAVAPPGVSIAVSPSSLTLDAGESADYDVTFTTLPGATFGEWTFGSLTWWHGPHSVRSPIAVKRDPLAAPDEVMGTGADGSLSFDLTFGYSGPYTAGAHGLVPADMQADTVVDDPADNISTALSMGVGVTSYMFDVPTGSAYARFALFDDYTDGNDDLDLYVFGPGGGFVGGSGSGTSTEEINVLSPAAGTYTIVVHGFQTDGPDANYTLFSWAVGGDSGNMTVTAPASATLGATETIDVAWTGLATGTKHLGAVSHSDAGGLLGLTVVRIDTD
ncbi:MAG: S8 family serine peptidase [Gammaproteobacteria bacterium]|jgi:subtilisin family serine protease